MRMPSLVSKQIEDQQRFRARIVQEWRRAERSSRPALLVLFAGLGELPRRGEAFIDQLAALFRDTDILGWYRDKMTLGVICLELGKSSLNEAREVISRKIDNMLLMAKDTKLSSLKVTIHLLPPYTGEGALDGADAEFAETFCRDMFPAVRAESAAKRLLDVTGSALLLFLLAPIFLVIMLTIRLTSHGPAFYRQVRTGLGGRPFTLYKFRTMVVNKDDRLHLEYVQRFIQGNAEKHLDENGQAIYKLTADPRITRVGRFLRRSSLDELPQLWNVLRGDMTLVGPRPPLPYEVGCYDLWHRRRVFELKPGLTGLWQVRGRSRCSFDEMIRLDLQHGKPHSLGLYVRVLLETPRAVFHGGGAQ